MSLTKMKVVRNLVSYMIFMKEPLFEIEMTTCDIRKIEIDLVSSKETIYRKYLQDYRGSKFKLHMFHKPPQIWCDQYDARRAIAEKKLAEKSRETVERANAPKEVKVKKSDIYKKHLAKFKEGAFGDMSLRQSCINEGLPYQSVMNMKAELDIK